MQDRRERHAGGLVGPVLPCSGGSAGVFWSPRVNRDVHDAVCGIVPIGPYLRTSPLRSSEKLEEIFREIPHPGDARRPQLGHHVYRAEALGQP